RPRPAVRYPFPRARTHLAPCRCLLRGWAGRRRARTAARHAPTRRVRRRARTGSRASAGPRRRPSSPPPIPRRSVPAWRASRFRSTRKCNMAEVIRIAAAGDVHASEAIRERVESAFERVEDEADVILLAGDLTTTGELEQAQVLADACRAVSIPVFAVLGNHDYHAGCATEMASLLTE